MAVQYKVVFPNLFLLHLSTFHTRIKKLNNASNERVLQSLLLVVLFVPWM